MHNEYDDVVGVKRYCAPHLIKIIIQEKEHENGTIIVRRGIL